MVEIINNIQSANDADDAVTLYGGVWDNLLSYLFNDDNPSTQEDLNDMDILLNYDETSMTVDSKSNTTGRKNVKSIDSPSDDDDDDDDNDETEVKNMKAIKEMTEDDFPLPDERIWGKPSSLLLKWSDTTPPVNSNSGIEVTLVTQCSLDRLSNLVKQLYHWGGKASVALYLKPSEWNPDLRGRLIEEITNLRARINKNYGEREFDIALRLVEGYSDGEPYPINYLRNVALLEAREQQLRFNPTLDKSAVLLGKNVFAFYFYFIFLLSY